MVGVEGTEVGLAAVRDLPDRVGQVHAPGTAPPPWGSASTARIPRAAHPSSTIATSASVSLANRFSATTAGTPNFATFSTCPYRFSMPARSASRSSLASESFDAPPFILSARMVETIATASGPSPPSRHLMSKNFSAPRSAPNPASVTTMSPSLSPARVAISELQPCAMLAKGPPWMNAGVPPASAPGWGGARRASGRSSPRGRRCRGSAPDRGCACTR